MCIYSTLCSYGRTHSMIAATSITAATTTRMEMTIPATAPPERPLSLSDSDTIGFAVATSGKSETIIYSRKNNPLHIMGYMESHTSHPI